jgi:BirA family biotin operon repressor/biotin-[acetyl-CoA-carboxylase] ligase
LRSSLPDELRAQPVPRDIETAWEQAADRLGLFAHRLRYLSTITSTNDLALRLADAGAEEGTTLLAETQTAGRGRRGRAWFSPPGSGLYVSVILRPSARDLAPHGTSGLTSQITLASGVALAEGVRASTGLPVELKWPNDLIVERRKLAGILAEAAMTGSADPAVVLGMGINVRASAYPPGLSALASSIEAELGREVDRALVLVETLAALASRYEDLRAGRFDAILTAWRTHARSLPGAAIEWDGLDGVEHGRAIDIAHDGSLLARTEHGIVRLVSGEVRWR